MKILYGVGVGPGDPELLTLKAVSCMREAQHIFVPRTRPEKPGLAEMAVQEYLHDKHVITFHFQMRADNAEQYAETAHTIDAAIKDGETGAFITLGDPLVYSTYIYVMYETQKLGIVTKTIPGIPSFTAAASAIGWPLAVKDEQVYVTDGDVDERILQQVHTVCILKPQQKKAEILETLEKQGFHYTCITRCSLPQEIVLHDKEAILQDREYMSLIIGKK